MCDNCLRQLKVDRQDVSAAAAAVVQTLQALPAADKRLTLTQLVDAWRKSQVPSLASSCVDWPQSPSSTALVLAIALLNCCVE